MNHAPLCRKYVAHERCSCGFDRTPCGLFRLAVKWGGAFSGFVIISAFLFWEFR